MFWAVDKTCITELYNTGENGFWHSVTKSYSVQHVSYRVVSCRGGSHSSHFPPLLFTIYKNTIFFWNSQLVGWFIRRNNIFHNKLKPKLSLCLIKHKAMQAHEGGERGEESGLITIWILTSALQGDECSGHAATRQNGHRYLPDRRPGGPNQSIWVFWRKELSLASRIPNPQPFSPQPCNTQSYPGFSSASCKVNTISRITSVKNHVK